MSAPALPETRRCRHLTELTNLSTPQPVISEAIIVKYVFNADRSNRSARTARASGTAARPREEAAVGPLRSALSQVAFESGSFWQAATDRSGGFEQGFSLRSSGSIDAEPAYCSMPSWIKAGFEWHSLVSADLGSCISVYYGEPIPSCTLSGSYTLEPMQGFTLAWSDREATSNSVFPPSVDEDEDAVGVLLSKLESAHSPAERQKYRSLLSCCDPVDIVAAAFAKYDQFGKEEVLLHAVSLLESFGNRAWDALLWIASTGRSEMELFLRLLADCPGVSENERFHALKMMREKGPASVRIEEEEE